MLKFENSKFQVFFDENCNKIICTWTLLLITSSLHHSVSWAAFSTMLGLLLHPTHAILPATSACLVAGSPEDGRPDAIHCKKNCPCTYDHFNTLYSVSITCTRIHVARLGCGSVTRAVSATVSRLPEVTSRPLSCAWTTCSGARAPRRP